MTYPYWRLSGFYWVYYAILGGLVPFWGRYFQLNGFDAQQIGVLMAVVSSARLIGPNVWAWIADTSSNRLFYLRLATICGAVFFVWVTLNQQYYLLILSIFAFAFCWGAVMPQFETIAMSHLADQKQKYTLVRLWGSIGYIVLSVAMGTLLDNYGAQGFSITLQFLFFGAILLSFSIPKIPVKQQAEHSEQSILKVFKNKTVIVFFLALLLLNMSHSPFYTYFDIYVTSYGYSGMTSGLLIAVGVMAEILVFLVVPRLIVKFGIKNLLIVSFFLASCRWLITASFIENIYMIVFAQLMHAATFGIAHAASIQWVARIFTGKLQSRGQAFFTSFTYGAGGVIGNLLFGNIWPQEDGAFYTFVIGSAVCFVGMVLIIFYIPSLRKERAHERVAS